MKLHKFLLTPPIVAISAALFCGALFAEDKNTFLGTVDNDWFNRDNWSLGHVPQADEAVVIDGKTVVAQGGFTINSLTLSGAAKLTVKANEIPTEDYDKVFCDEATTLDALRQRALVVQIAGNFTVGDTAVVYPESPILTGVPVIFKVGGDFTLAVGASFVTAQKGWGWSGGNWADRPSQYCKPCKKEGSFKDTGWTLAIGSGINYGTGGKYGGTEAGSTDKRDGVTYRYAKSYGPTFAPLFPGSPAGLYSGVDKSRGSSSIVVLAEGEAKIDGVLNADGSKQGKGLSLDDSGTSGGGIWLAASKFTFGSNALLTAEGGDSTANIYGPGGGGRIALAEGCSPEEIMAMYNGTLDTSALVETPSIDIVAVSVLGGQKPDGSRGSTGSLSLVRSVFTQATLTTQSDVPGLSAAGVAWGDQVLMNGSYEFTAPQYAVLADDPGIRYTCKGFVVSNNTQQIARGDGLTATVDIDGHYGPFTLTWKWGDRTEVDPEPVTRHWVGPASGGDFANAANWDPSGAPTRVDTLYLTGVKVSTIKLKAAKLVVSGGSLTIGSSEGREDFEFNVTGDVEIGDGATVNVYAPLKSDPADYTSVAAARGLLWQNRTKVEVGGTLSISGGATVKVDNHPESGDLIVFEVGSFDLAAGSTVTAAGTGFTWFPTGAKILPEGTILKTGTASVNGVNSTPCYTYGLGTVQGNGYSSGANHSYGLDYAPFEPGSCGGVYFNAKISRGGGSIVVFAKGAVTLNGTLNADAVLNSSYSGPSGGSIWVAGATIDRGEGVVVSACGQAYNNNSYGFGAGGRVAFMTDVTTGEQIERMVGGEKLEGYTYETMSFGGLSVDSGRRTPTSAPGGTPGTAVSAYDAQNYETVTVTASPLEAVSPLAKYGSFQAKGGQSIVREADAIGFDPTDPQNVRYICTGYVVSNATQEIAADTTTDLSFTVVKGEGPYTVTWQWGVRETRTQLSVTGPGAVTMNGQAEGEIWVPDSEAVTLAATPDDGKSFWVWIGTDVPEADAKTPTVVLATVKPHVVRAVFADLTAEAKTCTAKSSAKGDFYDPANWEGEVAPNPQDALAMSGGTLTASRRFACSALTMTGGSLSVAGTDEIAIPGDVLLSGNATWSITALPTNSATAFADGATRVTVDGDFSVTDTASVRPISDAYTGGSVVFRAQSFTLGEGAVINADEAGYRWTSVDVRPLAPGIGQDYRIGAGYGGTGGGANATYGKTYGFANAPVHPGSPNEPWNWTLGYCYKPGGLIRIHAKTMSVAGTLTANALIGSSHAAASGGGIWLTADEFTFASTAVLSAIGGNASAVDLPTAYNSMGGGGRIAVETGLTDGQFERLQATGKIGRKAYGEEVFTNRFSGVTVNVSGGVDRKSGKLGNKGTFVYMPEPPGLMLLVK